MHCQSARRSWRVPAGESPVQVRGSARLVASVAGWEVTTVAKRTQQSCGVGIEPRKAYYRRGRGASKRRRQHVRDRYARYRRSAGVGDQITYEGNASEPGRSHACPRPPCAVPGHVGKVEEPKPVEEGHEKSDGCIVPLKPRTTPGDSRWRRVWREGGRSEEGQVATHAPDTEPESACPPTLRAYGRTGWAAQAPNVGRV